MASGHVNRTNRPNTWLHRPSLRREKSPCQLGAVHTWHLAAFAAAQVNPSQSRQAIIAPRRRPDGRLIGGTKVWVCDYCGTQIAPVK